MLRGRSIRGGHMKHIRWTHIVHMFVISSLIAAEMPLIVLGATSSSKSTLTNDVIKQNEASKKEAEAEKNVLKSNLTNVQAMIDDLESSKNDLEVYIEELDGNLEEINLKIDDFTKAIEDKEQEIIVTQGELDIAKQKENNQYELMKKRIKFMYEKGNSSYLEILLTSQSFTDFINKADYIGRLSEYDRRMLNEYIAAKEAVSAKEAQLNVEQQELEARKTAVENEQSAMETLIAEKEEEITEYESDISNKEAAIAEYEAMIAAQDQIIKDMEAIIAAERKRLEEENRKAITYDGGKFKWPAPSYTRISDDYGNRIHPTLGTQQFHNGIDMAAPSGSPILAAYDGEVIAADYSSTMGNYIMIDHGDGLITIYMHASSLGVSKGQSVTKGQQIGAVGSTGRSTGPHLHFSVRLNGSYASPWNYLSK